MTRKRGADFDLDVALEDPGFTPRAKDVPALLDRVEEGTDTAEPAGRALLRLGAAGAQAAAERAARSSAPARARFTDLVARAIAEAPGAVGDELVAFAQGRLADEDARVRRYAASALAKLRGAAAEDGSVARALGEALAREGDASVRRALLSALGKVGGAAAIDALGAGDDETATRDKARLMAERTLARVEDSAFDGDIVVERPRRVVVRCRAGLESILMGELDVALEPVVPRDAWGLGRVEVTLTGAPTRLFGARTMLSFGFALPIEPFGKTRDLGEAIVRALASDEAVALLRHHTRGPLRYRIAWAAGGKRRAVVWRAAAAIAAARPELVNDPTASPWEAVVHEGQSAVAIELVPRVVDPRFVYRLGDVPAASHPTVAAALVRVAGVREDDVVWDPFVGSGTELCERALAGPYARLIGSDLDDEALAVARANLEAARAERVELVRADALRFTPAAPTLIITNPPMGRRVLRGEDLGAVLERFVDHAARTLVAGGRFVWISPLPLRTARAAERAGLIATMRREIDMGGFSAEIQAFSKR